MRLANSFRIAVLLLPALGWAANESFDKAMKALASNDYATALSLMETALSAEPDNMQFGSEYRQTLLKQAKQLHPKEGLPADFDRTIKTFEKLVAQHPNASSAWLNYGFAYVDKIPAAGAIGQVILANSALGFFTKSIDAKPTWIAYYTRGASYLYWPKIFGRAPLAVADLETAMKMQKAAPKRSYHVRGYVALGDAYWKIDNLERARAIWQEGLKEFPDAAALKNRLAKQGDDLKAFLDDVLDPSKRVDTDLRELWMNP